MPAKFRMNKKIFYEIQLNNLIVRIKISSGSVPSNYEILSLKPNAPLIIYERPLRERDFIAMQSIVHSQIKAENIFRGKTINSINIT